jgi:hypothetical protein
MTTWIAVISNDLIPDYIKELEVEADDREQAEQTLEETIRASSDLQNFSAINVRKKRGGARPGAGRKKGTQGTYGCETKVVRVPVDIAPQLPELIANIDQLRELLTDWEEEASKSTSPRYDRARKLISEIRGLGF